MRGFIPLIFALVGSISVAAIDSNIAMAGGGGHGGGGGHAWGGGHGGGFGIRRVFPPPPGLVITRNAGHNHNHGGAFPFGAWSWGGGSIYPDATIATPVDAAERPGFVRSGPLPPCREIQAGVTIIRGKSCHA